MTYTPINWQTGDTITAEKMNKMDNGWSAVQSVQPLFNETVTTEGPPPFVPDDPSSGSLSYSQKITADELVVTFDGNDYTCQKATYEGNNYYGGWNGGFDFSNIPFCIQSKDIGNSLKTETSGTFTLSAGIVLQSFEISEGFAGAVRSVKSDSFEIVLGTTIFTEANEAFLNGNRVYVMESDSSNAYQYQVIYIDEGRYTLYALVPNGNTCDLTTFSASSASDVIE